MTKGKEKNGKGDYSYPAFVPRSGIEPESNL